MLLVTLPLLAWMGFGTAEQPVDRSIDGTILKVEAMVSNTQARRAAQKHGLDIMNVTWEDTGRSKGSSVGPNISDMTIGVRDSTGALHPMPVIRFDNFNDKTADVRSDKFFVLTGNERGGDLSPTSLESMLKDTREYLHRPSSWKGKRSSLWNDRDEHVLVSAQAAFLPVPKNGQATFTPVIYNYQSYTGAPAVLTMVATREGTSVQVIENDGGYMSEVLYFNADGQRAPLTATRLSDFKAQGGDKHTPASHVSADSGADTVLIVQVPLKQAPQLRRASKAFSAPPSMEMAEEDGDLESAVIGHGATEGPFTEIHDLNIERDDRFPVRVTVQFYQATTTGQITDRDVAAIRKRIDRVYSEGDYVGSLVTAGHTGRPTEWVAPKPVITEHARWANPWWNTGN